MSDFLERLKQEKKDLQDKTEKLSDFLAGDASSKLSEANCILLHRQLHVMSEYLDILIVRLEIIGK